MTLTSQQYANLTEHSYDRDGGMHQLVDKEVVLEGNTYRVLRFVDNPRTGYQGTIYQHVESGEVVVAHRGTEFERQRWHDLVKTDGAMVLARVNLQADDAVTLTRLARDYASSPSNVAQYGGPSQVTVTGHSLGGTLAQISAHHYGLRGETFNAYGAVSLDRRISTGGDRVLNHVMAADTVSSASRHYGQVRIYALAGEIDMLRAAGYANNDARLLDPRASLLAGIKGFSSHDMHLFLNVDGDKRTDRSVLDDPQTRRLAREYAPMIGKYRDDVEGMRAAVTIAARGPYGTLRDGVDALRGPLLPGELGAREDRARQMETLQAWGTFAAHARAGDRNREGRADGTESSTMFHAPLRLDARSPATEVGRLLSSAGVNDAEGMNAAMLDLQTSSYGREWKRQLEHHQQRINELVPRTESHAPAEHAR